MIHTPDKNVVSKAVESFRQAMVSADKPALENLLEEECSYGHFNGLIDDKSSFIEPLVSGRIDFKVIEISNQTIKVARDVAIVRHSFRAEVVNGGIVQNPNLGALQVWQKQNGQWRLLARQAFKLQVVL